jgi:hypothetical protein
MGNYMDLNHFFLLLFLWKKKLGGVFYNDIVFRIVIFDTSVSIILLIVVNVAIVIILIAVVQC